MTNLIGAHWSVKHRYAHDYAYFQRLQPTVFKIFDGGPPDYLWARQNLPGSTIIIARYHFRSEQHGDMLRDPVGTGRRHAEEWAADANYLGFDKSHTYCEGINEPHVWETGVLEALRRYTIAYCDRGKELGLRVAAVNVGVGWLGNNGPDTPPDWSPLYGVEAAIVRGNHILACHEYWDSRGPDPMWGWHAGRILKCPWKVRIVVTECGIDLGVVGQAGAGWRHAGVSQQEYAKQIHRYATRMAADERFFGCTVFASDFADDEWWSFELSPAYNAILALPPVVPIPAPPPPPAAKIVWPVVGGGTVTGQFGEPYTPPTGAAYLHEGLDIAAPLGTPVVAVSAGVVVFNGVDSEYGNYLRIFHKQRFAHTFYAHMQQASPVQVGARVTVGQQIGNVGSTGNSSGPHLHFEVRCCTNDGSYVNTCYGFQKGRCNPQTALWLWGLR